MGLNKIPFCEKAGRSSEIWCSSSLFFLFTSISTTEKGCIKTVFKLLLFVLPLYTINDSRPLSFVYTQRILAVSLYLIHWRIIPSVFCSRHRSIKSINSDKYTYKIDWNIVYLKNCHLCSAKEKVNVSPLGRTLIVKKSFPKSLESKK